MFTAWRPCAGDERGGRRIREADGNESRRDSRTHVAMDRKGQDRRRHYLSGSETMMTDFVVPAMDGLASRTRKSKPLYLRPLSILVRPGNPENINGRARPPQARHQDSGSNGAG